MKEIKKFKQHIKDKNYFEAHEALEELWFPIRKTKTDYCLVLKGFINGAVSLELFKRGKIAQSKNVYQIYLKYTSEKKLYTFEKKEKFQELKIFMDKVFKAIGKNYS